MSLARLHTALVTALMTLNTPVGRAADGPFTAKVALSRARDAAVRIPKPFDRIQTLVWIAREHVLGNDRTAAIETVELAQSSVLSVDPESRGVALHNIAAAFAAAGERDRAVRAADLAAKMKHDAAEIETLKRSVLWQVAKAFCERRDFATAEEIGRLAGESESSRNDMLRCICFEQARSGDIAGALVTLERLPVGYGRTALLLDIAGAYGKAGRSAEGFAVVSRLPERVRFSGWNRIVLAQAANKDWKGVLNSARELGDRLKKGDDELDPIYRSLVEYVAVCADSGDLERGAEITESLIRCRFCRSVALAHLSAATAKAGRKDQAEALMTRARQTAKEASVPGADSDELFRSYVFAQIANIQANAGDRSGAEATIGSISDSDCRAGSLAVLAEACAKAGDRKKAAALFDAAEKCLDKDDPDRTSGAYVEIDLVRAMVRSGFVDRALTVPIGCRSTDRRWTVYRQIATQQATSGGADEAAVWIGKLKDPGAAANAWLGVAAGIRTAATK